MMESGRLLNTEHVACAMQLTSQDKHDEGDDGLPVPYLCRVCVDVCCHARRRSQSDK